MVGLSYLNSHSSASRDSHPRHPEAQRRDFLQEVSCGNPGPFATALLYLPGDYQRAREFLIPLIGQALFQSGEEHLSTGERRPRLCTETGALGALERVTWGTDRIGGYSTPGGLPSINILQKFRPEEDYYS